MCFIVLFCFLYVDVDVVVSLLLFFVGFLWGGCFIYSCFLFVYCVCAWVFFIVLNICFKHRVV